MKTTRTLRIALLALVAANLATYLLLHANLPVAELFEYATGMIVAAGLCAFLVAEPAARRALPPAGKPTTTPTGLRPAATRRALVHAM
jgi:hypothetical protein